MDLTVLYNLTYGLYVLGSEAPELGHPAGCVINTCFQVTSENPTVAISLNKHNYTLEAIRHTGRFSLSIVAEDTDPALISTFGFHSSRDMDKYAAFGLDTVSDVPMVHGKFCGRLILRPVQYVDCGTHELVIAALEETVPGEGKPMTYAYYHNVIKGSAPKAAPTYRAPEATAPSAKHRYECDICGYVAEFDGPVPPDYICPICGADASHFHEI